MKRLRIAVVGMSLASAGALVGWFYVHGGHRLVSRSEAPPRGTAATGETGPFPGRTAATSPARRPPPAPSPPAVATCWTTKRPETCAEEEYAEAESRRSAVYAEVEASSGAAGRPALGAAEEAWTRYRDAHLRSLESYLSCRREPECSACGRIVITWLTRGRIAELERMLRPAGRDTAASDEACEGPPAECTGALTWLREAEARLAVKSRPNTRVRLRAERRAWARYREAQAAAIVASRGENDARIAKRAEEAGRLRLSVDRTSHLGLLSEFQADAKSRCERLLRETALLAEMKARCDAGQVPSCNSLAQALEGGWYGSDRDRPRAVALYTKACDGGHVPACETLAYAASVGRAMPKDPSRAVGLLTRGCDLGSASSCQRLAWFHARGEGVAQDGAKALALARRACDLSRTDSRSSWDAGPPCETLMTRLETGEGLPRNLALSLELRLAACERNDTASCARAAQLLRKQPGFDVARVASLYEKACRNDSGACLELGTMYRDGDAVAKDAAAAVKWFDAACSTGFLPGCRAARALTGEPPPGDPDDAVSEPGYIRTMRIVVHPKLPALRLRLFGDDYGVVSRIDVFDEGRRRVTQRLGMAEEGAMVSPEPRLPESADVNFDGYQDLMLIRAAGANNWYGRVWTYEPKARRFDLRPELSEASNLRVDARARVLRSGYHFSAMEGSAGDYRWIGGRFVMVREERRYLRPDGCLEDVIRERRGGRLVVTHRSCE